MTERSGKSVCRQDASDHAIVLDYPLDLRHCGLDVLERKERHPFQSRFMSEKAVVEVIVVGAGEIDGELRNPDLADVHKASRVENGGLEVAALERGPPVLQCGNQERVFGASQRLAVPAVVRQQRKIEQGFAPLPVTLRQILKDVAFYFTHVPVGIEHLPRVHRRLRKSACLLVVRSRRKINLRILSSRLARRPCSCVIWPLRGCPMAKNGFKVMDSDMHVVEPPDLWQRYIDPEFKARAPIGLTRHIRDLGVRSEEHTSELQSPCNLVCRLLLE